MLPLWLIREVYREYELQEINVERDAACALLEEQLAASLEGLVGNTGEVRKLSWTSQIRDGLIRVTAQSECLEEIGLEILAAHE